MTNKEYIAGAVRTEAPITSELLGRLTHYSTVAFLQSALRNAMDTGQRVDALKKHIFYGKKENWRVDKVNSISGEMANRLSDPQTVRLLHAAMGFCTESAEILEALCAHLFTGKPLDGVNLLEEMGDMFWYSALFADAIPTTFEHIQERNNAKLRARYPEKFTEAKAITRDLKQEHNALAGTGSMVGESFLCDTLATENGAKIIGVDNEHGYIHGYLIGGDGRNMVWGLADGCLLGPGNGRQALDMASFNREVKLAYAEGKLSGRK